MWYAVDKNGDKYIYSKKPVRNEPSSYCEQNCWEISDEEDVYEDEDTAVFIGDIDVEGLPEITWKDEPVEVKLICERV